MRNYKIKENRFFDTDSIDHESDILIQIEKIKLKTPINREGVENLIFCHRIISNVSYRTFIKNYVQICDHLKALYKIRENKYYSREDIAKMNKLLRDIKSLLPQIPLKYTNN